MRKPNYRPLPVNRDFRHWPQHVIYREADSIPKARVQRVVTEMEEALVPLLRQFPHREVPNHPDGPAYRIAVSETREHYQVLFDDMLHRFHQSPMRLRSPAAHRIVIDSWLHLAEQYDLKLFAISVMSNHVHVLVMANGEDAVVPFKPLLAAHRRFTSRRIKPLLENPSAHTWARGAFDRDVRPGTFWRVVWYVLQNPVKAGLVKNCMDYTGTYVDAALLEQLRGYGYAV